MTVAEFEEKTDEIAYDVEMSLGSGPTPWAPGQVLEHLVGFDAAASPSGCHPLWRVLGAPRPKGLVLLPDHWKGLPGRRPGRRALPSNPVSFMVQFKRPEFIRSHAAKQWKLWRAPYYRFKIDSWQQRTLKQLERNAADDAIVRYAAPVFVTNQAMDVARLDSRVIASSGQVSPTILSGHSAWTYASPGSSGRANPTGKESHFERHSDLFRERDDQEKPPLPDAPTDIMPVDTIGEHVGRLAKAALYHQPELRSMISAWTRQLLQDGVRPEAAVAVSHFAAVQTLMSRVGASWWVFDRNTLV